MLTWLGATGSDGCAFDYLIDADEEIGGTPIARTMLFQNAPNPFNPTTTVRYSLAERTHVRLTVYDVGGRLVRTLVDEVQKPDHHRMAWDGLTDGGERVASGLFWVRMITAGGFEATTKMVVLR